MEKLTRRKFLERAGRAAVAVPAISLVGIQTAYAATSVDCPIYMFHQTTGSAVENVIRTNARLDRIPINVRELSEIIRGERPAPQKSPFCLTFDDGYLVQYQQAVPVLDRYEAPATFFVMGTAWQGDRIHSYMNSEQIRDLFQRGYEIGSHTINHRDLVRLRATDYNGYLAEVFSSKEELEDLLEDEVTSFAYPNGSFNQGIIQDVSSAYKAAVSTAAGRVQSDNFTYALRRIRVN